MTSSAKSKVLSVGVSTLPDALDRFEAAWHLATGRAAPAPVARLNFADLPLLLKSLSPARWQLLAALRRQGPMSVRSLSKQLGRDYKNVHTDVAQLAGLGLIERTGRSLVRVPWDAVRAELKL
jgi:predicted transcriptional regulator